MSVVINLRAKEDDRDLFDRVAALLHTSRTEFLLDAAREKAQRVLLDQAIFQLDPARFDQMQAMLDAPAATPKALRALLKSKSPWDA
ncbi:DUF1778 domain-containing protein [soil metagenome]